MAQAQHDSAVLEKEETKSEEPPLYACVLKNDDYTTFEFVMEILMNVFNKSEGDAAELTVRIHEKGEGAAGIYPKEIATFKQQKVMDLAFKADYPLECVVRPESPSPKRGPGPR